MPLMRPTHETCITLGRVPESPDADPSAEQWLESETHEGCIIFGYVDVSRAPGTLHLSPHSSRHSFDFSAVNTSHHIDHLSFGLELTARERARLPPSVAAKLTTLDDVHLAALEKRETKEHHIIRMHHSVDPLYHHRSQARMSPLQPGWASGRPKVYLRHTCLGLLPSWPTSRLRLR